MSDAEATKNEFVKDAEGKCSLREELPIKAAHPAAFSVFDPSV